MKKVTVFLLGLLFCQNVNPGFLNKLMLLGVYLTGALCDSSNCLNVDEDGTGLGCVTFCNLKDAPDVKTIVDCKKYLDEKFSGLKNQKSTDESACFHLNRLNAQEVIVFNKYLKKYPFYPFRMLSFVEDIDSTKRKFLPCGEDFKVLRILFEKLSPLEKLIFNVKMKRLLDAGLKYYYENIWWSPEPAFIEMATIIFGNNKYSYANVGKNLYKNKVCNVIIHQLNLRPYVEPLFDEEDLQILGRSK